MSRYHWHWPVTNQCWAAGVIECSDVSSPSPSAGQQSPQISSLSSPGRTNHAPWLSANMTPSVQVLQKYFCTIRDLSRNSIKTRIWYSADLNYNPGFIYLWQWQRSWSILKRILTPETLYFKFHCDFVLSPRAKIIENLPLFFISRSEGKLWPHPTEGGGGMCWLETLRERENPTNSWATAPPVLVRLPLGSRLSHWDWWRERS